MRAIVAAIHGIMCRQTDASWPDRFDAWTLERDPFIHVVKRKYFELPLPRLNWLKNRWIARGLAAELLELRKENPLWPIWFIAHSNGCCIAWLTARRLIEAGIPVAGMILTGGALEAEVTRNQVLDWVKKGKLGAAIAYSSIDDAVVAGDARVAPTWYWRVRDFVWGRMMWPYGCLGRSGWMFNGTQLDQVRAQHQRVADLLPERIFTRWYNGGHSTYFVPDRIRCTFEQFVQDMRQPRRENGRRCVTSEDVAHHRRTIGWE